MSPLSLRRLGCLTFVLLSLLSCIPVTLAGTSKYSTSPPTASPISSSTPSSSPHSSASLPSFSPLSTSRLASVSPTPPITLLIHGQSQSGSAQTGSSVHYAFYQRGPALNSVYINLTALSGDPDLFVTLGSCSGLPSPQCYSWCSTNIGSDAVHVAQAEPGLYYVAVYAFFTSQFIITASSISAFAPAPEPTRDEKAQRQLSLPAAHAVTPAVSSADSGFCGIGQHNFRSLAAAEDLSGSWDGQSFFLRLCGAVSQPDCAAAFPSSATICQLRGSTAFLIANSSAVTTPEMQPLRFSYSNGQNSSDGIDFTVSNGEPCGPYGPRKSQGRLQCGEHHALLSFVEQPLCTYRFVISSPLACPQPTAAEEEREREDLQQHMDDESTASELQHGWEFDDLTEQRQGGVVQPVNTEWDQDLEGAEDVKDRYSDDKTTDRR